ncbi:GNAT family N-acetyltransferase [Streptomyces sp. NPDC056161]|uniref:GNAT family N-acetyltransferase n=1 Tax=Streptomyces sp. NPDC056161 TaxID=3345732 RepID=UPI0035DED1DA
MSTEIYRDAWGIPHLRADSVRELARAQGRVTALDRAWQLEVERHRSCGTSASFLGAEALSWDVFARRARLDDTARRCFAALERRDPETADWVRAYVDGVNEGLGRGARRAPEFTGAGLAPGRWEPWTPMGVWLGTHVLFAGFPAKLWREWAARHLGPDAVGLFATDGPGSTGSNGWLVSGARTATGRAVLAGDPHRFVEEPGVYQQIRLACPEFDVVGLAVPGVPGIAHFGHTGTVAWSITNAMADYQDLYRERLRRTGAGVEALGPDGDWRRAHRHMETVRVAGEAPVEIEIIETDRGPLIVGGPEGLDGVAEDPDGVPEGLDGMPEAPGGRPESPGGRPEGPGGVPAEEGFHAAVLADSATPGVPKVPSTPEAPGVPTVPSAPSTPLLPLPLSSPLALALRFPPRVTEDLGFGALLPLLRARRVGDVDRAFDRWVEPVNVVQAADTEGGLLHRVAGWVPERAGVNRLRPVPAWESAYAWRGRHSTPRAGLTDGIAVMANQRGPAAPLGVEFAPPHRADRIRALLDGRRVWSAADMAAIHTDTHLASAGPLLARLAALNGLTPEAARLRDRLLAWNRRMDADSSDAAAYAAVRGAVVRHLAAHPAFAPLAEPPAYPDVLLPWLALVPRIGYALEHLLTAEKLYGIDRPAAVRAAVEEVAATPPSGTWADTHRLAPWRARPGTPYRPEAEPGLSGDHDCVLCTSAVPGLTDLAARGPAARYVWDLARREDSRWVVPFGADGVPGAPHHRDQLDLWVRGELVPVVTDWTRLTRETTMPDPHTDPHVDPHVHPYADPYDDADTGPNPGPYPGQYPGPHPGPYGDPGSGTPYAAVREAVHEQRVDGFGTVRVLPLDPRADAAVVHAWVSEERAVFWGMNGLTEDQVAEIYAHLATLDTHHAFLMAKDGEPVALFQTYEPAADRVGECYETRSGDIGIHLLLAPAGPAGTRPGWTAALLSVLTAYVLRGLGRRRIVVDPDVRNEKAVARFLKSGFVAGPAVVLPEVDLPDVQLPEKHAQLAFLDRAAVFPEEDAGA